MTMPDSLFAATDSARLAKDGKTPRAHLVGIAGSGMRSLAQVLRAAGWKISGSDINPQSLHDPRFKVHAAHDGDQIDGALDVVIHTSAIEPANPELSRARQLGIPTLSYSQVLGQMMSSRNSAAVAGTHGKSTTTAMAGEILRTAGIDATVIFGAEPIEPRSGSRFGHSRAMLVEACEYQANFRYLRPSLAAIFGIERDHFDCFPTACHLESAFGDFLQQVPEDGLVLARAECETTTRLVAPLKATRESFGLTPAATWRATALRERRGLYSFEIRCHGRLLCDAKLNVAGQQNVLNALAAAALASHCGATARAIRDGLARFAGLKRRLEVVCDRTDLALVDDYAHHPTAVASTLATVRQMYPLRRVWCVFQPHQVSRTAHLMADFARSLQNADRIVVADVVPARETPGVKGEGTSAELASRVARSGKNAVHLPTLAAIRDHIRHSLAAGDVVVTMGAGDIGTIAHDLTQGLRALRQAG